MPRICRYADYNSDCDEQATPGSTLCEFHMMLTQGVFSNDEDELDRYLVSQAQDAIPMRLVGDSRQPGQLQTHVAAVDAVDDRNQFGQLPTNNLTTDELDELLKYGAADELPLGPTYMRQAAVDDADDDDDDDDLDPYHALKTQPTNSRRR